MITIFTGRSLYMALHALHICLEEAHNQIVRSVITQYVLLLCIQVLYQYLIPELRRFL
jgi:hypothetical protein